MLASNKNVFPERLQQLDTRRGAESECSPGYAGPTRLCTVSRKRDAMACMGDSGGPQVQRGKGGRWELIGVTSGPGDTDVPCANGPGLYTNVPAYSDWMHRTIHGHSRLGAEVSLEDRPGWPGPVGNCGPGARRCGFSGG